MTFGIRLKKARKNKQLIQSEVAKALGIDFTTISKYENDKSEPDHHILQKLADLYEVSIDWLLTGDTKSKGNLENRIYFNGEYVKLTDDEAKHLKDTLEMYRLWKQSKEEK
ncbi:helix-turn-helix domain-containing protein [Chengkuizengella axinellae]|uniref:Helix-turn-helix transcriptional regulator n=1 Tax=Chengkuizengella axinellae TaxID=3064388 RepID=A0ABT9J2E2_9BACL|nr:helix-turn-helix transcriptional regulator [Chengkuizengella sp. 2205SS18-9]MDP5275776.1 helix-turn-helix transcriptional regulator [Chengkuizengella sp. 2205SS18-9]